MSGRRKGPSSRRGRQARRIAEARRTGRGRKPSARPRPTTSAPARGPDRARPAVEVGFIGLGRMGFPMARNLAQGGYRVHVHDVSPEASRRAAAVPGLTVHPSVREVAAALGLKTEAAKNSIFRAVRKMRAALEPFVHA